MPKEGEELLREHRKGLKRPRPGYYRTRLKKKKGPKRTPAAEDEEGTEQV